MMVSSTDKYSKLTIIHSSEFAQATMSSQSSPPSEYLKSWYQRNNGQYVLASLRAALEPVLDVSFGYHILQMGVAPGCELYQHSTINHRIYTGERPGQAVNLVTQGDELPLESDSIDTLIAHHSLEFSANPHGVLREMQRVVAPQGQILIVGFNPYSLLGAGAAARRFFSRDPLWMQQQPLSRHRLTDWLHLVGCEVQSCTHIYGLPPVGRGKLNAWLARADAWSNSHNLPTGGLYVLHAIKQVSAHNKPRFLLRERRERLIGLAVPSSSVVPRSAPAVPKANNVTPKSGEAAA